MTVYQIANVADLLLSGQVICIGLTIILSAIRPNCHANYSWTGVIFVLWLIIGMTFPYFYIPGIGWYRVVGLVLYMFTALFYARYCYGPRRKWILPLQLVITTNAVLALWSLMT